MSTTKISTLKVKAAEFTTRSNTIKNDILGKVDELNKVNDSLSAVTKEIESAINELAAMRDNLEVTWTENTTITEVIEEAIPRKKKGGKA